MKRIVAAALATGAIAVGAVLGLPAAFASGSQSQAVVSASASTVGGCVVYIPNGQSGDCTPTDTPTSFSVPVDGYVSVGACARNDSGKPLTLDVEQISTTFGMLYNDSGPVLDHFNPGTAIGQTATDDISRADGPRNEIHGGGGWSIPSGWQCFYDLLSSTTPGTATVSFSADGVTLDSTVQVTFHS